MTKRSGNLRDRQDIFSFSTASRPALGPTQRVPGALSPRIKQLEGEAEHLPPSSDDIKNAWSYNSVIPYVFMALCFSIRRI